MTKTPRNVTEQNVTEPHGANFDIDGNATEFSNPLATSLTVSPDTDFAQFCEKIPEGLRPTLFPLYLLPKAPGKYIESTDEIVLIIKTLNDWDMKILQSKRKRLKFLFKEKNLSHDLVDWQ